MCTYMYVYIYMLSTLVKNMKNNLDGAEGKSLKTRTSGGPRARESWFSLRASEAPPPILGPSEAARRLPGPQNRIFLKLSPLISELLLGPPWASLGLPEPAWWLLAAPGHPRSQEIPGKPIITSPLHFHIIRVTLHPGQLGRAKKSQNPSSFGWPGTSQTLKNALRMVLGSVLAQAQNWPRNSS